MPVGVEGGAVTTAGSNFDTEIAIYDADGNVLAQNDDIAPGNLQSRVSLPLEPGSYFLGVTGWNVEWLSGPVINYPGSCSRAGTAQISIQGSQNTVTTTRTIAPGRSWWYEFTVVADPNDCDRDGTPDSQELDCDGDGIPDECQWFDEDLFFMVGPVGESGTPFTISTVGSDYDTEIALWSFGDGDEPLPLIAQNDDIMPGNFQSEITRTLAPGEYAVAVAGFNASFSDIEAGTGVLVNIGGCSDGGELVLSLGDMPPLTMQVPPGRVVVYRFTIELAVGPCNAADLADPFGLLDLADIAAFANAFLTSDPLADINGNGLLDLSDINGFVSAFVAGCP